MRKITVLIAALAILGMLATSAFAYTLNANGTGWVGKGEVQTVFGWNNHAMQTYHTGVIFRYEDQASYSAVCTFTTGAGTPGEQTHNITIPRHVNINSAVASDSRKTGQWTGWHLNGWGAGATAGTVPVVGESCVATENGVARTGTWSAVIETGSSGGGLYAIHAGQEKRELLP
jgi:hypothetical protein